MISKKISQIQDLIQKQNLDGLVIGNFGHQVADDLLYYLLLRKLELGAMFIPHSGRATLWGISFETPALKKEYPGLRVLPFHPPLAELLAIVLSKYSRIGIRASALPSGIFEKLKDIKKISWRPIGGDAEMMGIKLPEEANRIGQACRTGDTLFSSLLKKIPFCKTEAEASQFLLTEMARLGVEPSFPPIIASGIHAADPHHTVENTRLLPGFCVIDMGVRQHGYCSDMTRTVYLGTPSDRERKLYRLLAQTQRKTIALAGTGTTTTALDTFCRTQLGQKLSDQFIHRLGHGLGTQVHEWPSVGPEPILLSEGMIITIEPGVYKRNAYGIRIEDDILITKTNARVLTKSPKHLITIGR